MNRLRTTVSGAAIALAALGLVGCSHPEPASPPAMAPVESSPPTAVAPPRAPVLPAPEALAGVLYRLADPAVPGAEKLDLIEGAKPTAADTVDRFATALKDGGYLPLTFDVTNVAWSDRDPGNAAADVNVTTAKPETGGFAFPMEFTPHADDWALSAKTAEMLLAFGNSATGAPPAAPPGG